MNEISQTLNIRRKGCLLVLILIVILPVSYTSAFQGKTTEIEINYSITLNAIHSNISISTYLGGNYSDSGYGIVVTSNNCSYVTGYTWSSDFPILNAYDNTLNGEEDAFVAKFAANGSLLWSTFLGGGSIDEGRDIAVTSDGSCYITGYTFSDNFPMINAYNSTFGGLGDAFIAKFATNGSLLWSTYIGGSDDDIGESIAIASDEIIFVSGSTGSQNFPIKDAYDDTFNGGIRDNFIVKIDASGAILWSTYLGGGWYEYGGEIAVSNLGDCYITGYTYSGDFPTKDAFNNTLWGTCDAFVAKYASNGNLLWSTYLGGSNADFGNSITVASDGSSYVIGDTKSNDFPTINSYNSTHGGDWDVFIVKFSSSGSLLWSTYLGGDNDDMGEGIAVNINGDCYVTGFTISNNFPTLNAYDNTFNDNNSFSEGDVFVTKYSTNGLLFWSTFLGGAEYEYGYGITTGLDDSCYVTGRTESHDFPTLNAYNNTNSGDDVFITKFIEVTIPTTTHKFSSNVFWGLVFVIPILAFILRKRRK